MTPAEIDAAIRAAIAEWHKPPIYVQPEYRAIWAAACEACAISHDKEAAERFPAASENTDLYRGFRNGLIRAAETCRDIGDPP